MKKCTLLTAIVLVGCVGDNAQVRNVELEEPVIGTVQREVVIEVIEEDPIDPQELECLAKNVYFESRGEDISGQIAVAHVTINRKNSRKYPNTLCDVIKQGQISTWFLQEKNKIVPLRNRCQFSWYCDGRSDVPTDKIAWQNSMQIAKDVIDGLYSDPTGGAMWYHNLDVDPHWRSDLSEVAQIDNHIFYR